MKKSTKVIIGVVLAIIIIGSIANASNGSTSNSNSSSTEITLSDFNKVKIGMSYSKVEDKLGKPGTLVSEDKFDGYTIKIYSWDNSDGSNMMLTFTNDELDSKAQAGLQ